MMKKIEEYSKNEDIIDTYDREYAEKKAMYINMMEARNEGIAEGEHTEKINIARNMIKKEIDINTISEITGLSIEEINELKTD